MALHQHRGAVRRRPHLRRARAGRPLGRDDRADPGRRCCRSSRSASSSATCSRSTRSGPALGGGVALFALPRRHVVPAHRRQRAAEDRRVHPVLLDQPGRAGSASGRAAWPAKGWLVIAVWTVVAAFARRPGLPARHPARLTAAWLRPNEPSRRRGRTSAGVRPARRSAARPGVQRAGRGPASACAYVFPGALAGLPRPDGQRRAQALARRRRGRRLRSSSARSSSCYLVALPAAWTDNRRRSWMLYVDRAGCCSRPSCPSPTRTPPCSASTSRC